MTKIKRINIYCQLLVIIFLKVWLIVWQITIILMYVSSQTTPESAVEDDRTKNKM